MEHEALRKLPHHQTHAGEGAAVWEKMYAAWQVARSAIEQAAVANPQGFDPEHMAQLRMQELRAWKNLQNAAVLATLGKLDPEQL
jgi:hypothetical protein